MAAAAHRVMTCSRSATRDGFIQRRCHPRPRLDSAVGASDPSSAALQHLRSCVALVLELVVKRRLRVVRSVRSRVAEPRVSVARGAALALDLAVVCSLLAHLLIRPMPTLSRRRH